MFTDVVTYCDLIYIPGQKQFHDKESNFRLSIYYTPETALSKHFICINLFNPHNNPVKQMLYHPHLTITKLSHRAVR